MTVGGRVGALWIGGLEPYMDETFLQVSFIAFTFTASITTAEFEVKLRNITFLLLFSELLYNESFKVI